MRLHIVQGGIENGDKAWLEQAARRQLTSSTTWVVPKTSEVGDQVVFYVGRFGFFATGMIKSQPKPKRNRPSRYGAAVGDIRLITPAISLAAIRHSISALTWAKYPRSITTPTASIAGSIRKLIARRRRTQLPELDAASIAQANLAELRALALARSVPHATARTARRVYRVREHAIRLYVLRRADGVCEACEGEAPFTNREGLPYLEPHHITRLADEGPDHPARVAAVCPNCHKRAHHSFDARVFNRRLQRRVARIEQDTAV